MGATLVVWVGGLAVGFALIYLPFVDELSCAPNVPFGEKGVVEALYISGVPLTTVGFGDVVATRDALRLVTVLEAASGLLSITATVTYVLSVNPLLTELRTSARIQADLGSPELQRATLLAERPAEMMCRTSTALRCTRSRIDPRRATFVAPLFRPLDALSQAHNPSSAMEACYA